MRDLRDPQKLGELLLEQAVHVRRAYGDDISLPEVYDEHVRFFPVSPYRDGGFISSNPADHHSQTPQNMGNLDNGGAS